MTIDTLLIIGGGLIGSSIARAAKQYGQAKTIYVSDKSASACEAIERLGFADGVAENAPELYASQADLIILCVPPGRIGEVAETVGKELAPWSPLWIPNVMTLFWRQHPTCRI